ncbi:uncharacterized protein E0L32_012071 [Thyridium curvatum]|uniref:Uncharacterized protein n=1 Tax=Thyridium curvatum TaxID=1093900 RepID=A0A507BE76_9PEZI|nr:uncharacterized protein E0L32_012071 [Thyridium curvatum]TPX17626.1 hypothetical protein E0L32_012071 [Thyridium curvatum]
MKHQFAILSGLAVWGRLGLAANSLTIDVTSKLQTMDGFGISQAFGRADEFKNLASGPQKQGLDYLFSTTSGAGFSIIRNRVASGDTAYDSIEPNSPGSPSATPHYVWDGSDSGQVWFSQQAMSYGVKAIYANAWNAPSYMRTAVDYGRLCGTPDATCASGDWRQAYANLIIQYLKNYEQLGIPITHVGFLNEPDGSNFMLASPEQAASMIPIMHNTLESNGLGHIQLTCCDDIGWKAQQTYTKSIIQAGMEKYLGVITSHTYSDQATTPMGTSLKTWVTEAADLVNPWCTTWYSNGGDCEGFTWSVRLAQGIVDAGLSAYLYWEGLEVNQQKHASYLVLSDGTNVFPSGRLWAFAHWSRYIRPGAQRVAVSGTVADVITAAFVNTDGSVVAVLTNSGAGATSIEFGFSGVEPSRVVDAVSSDNSAQMANTQASLSGGKLQVSVPAHGVVTVKMEAGGVSNNKAEAISSSSSSSSSILSSSSSSSILSSSSSLPHSEQSPTSAPTHTTTAETTSVVRSLTASTLRTITRPSKALSSVQAVASQLNCTSDSIYTTQTKVVPASRGTGVPSGRLPGSTGIYYNTTSVFTSGVSSRTTEVLTSVGTATQLPVVSTAVSSQPVPEVSFADPETTDLPDMPDPFSCGFMPGRYPGHGHPHAPPDFFE